MRSAACLRIRSMRPVTPAKARASQRPRPQAWRCQWGGSATASRETKERGKKKRKSTTGSTSGADHRHLRKRGFDSIDPADLRGTLRWLRLYTSARPGIDGGKTAVLNQKARRYRYFQAPVRSTAPLSSEQLRVNLGHLVNYARGNRGRHRRRKINCTGSRSSRFPAIGRP